MVAQCQKEVIYCPYCGARFADLGHTHGKGNRQREKGGFKMKRCPLCDKKIPEDAKFCPLCGWDLTDHELTPPRMARIQEEIVNARFETMRWQISMVQFMTVGLVFIILSLLASSEVIVVHATWVLSAIAAGFLTLAVPLSFLALRYHNKQDRLKIMLRDGQSYQ